MSPDVPTGVLPVIATPFDADDAVDVAALADEIDWLIEQGSDGITLAMVSEIRRLSEAERAALTDTVCRLVAGRVPVIASVGAESTAVARELALAARRSGASAVMATPPLLGPTSADALRHYLDVLVGAAGVPVVLQDASAYVGVAIPAQVQADLVLELGPSTLLLKPEAAPVGPVLAAIREATAGAALAYDGGGGADLVDTFRLGVVGTMPGPDLVWAVRRAWDLLALGRSTDALRITSLIASVGVLAPGLDGYVAVEKHLLHRQGVLPAPRVRGPEAFVLSPTSQALVDELADLLLVQVAAT